MANSETLFTDIDNHTLYQKWRDLKLSLMPSSIDELFVAVSDPTRLSKVERETIQDLLKRTNMAIFITDTDDKRSKAIPLNISAQFGMHRLDHNMGADDDGVSELSVRDGQWRGGYIPYTNKPIHWHTDGYYNEQRYRIHGMVLYCVDEALQGGENRLLDHEIAYIHLRDTNPEYIRALSHPNAMTIPANVVEGKEIRPDRTGPVFTVNLSGSLHMRYTARKRSVIWRDDEITTEAVACLSEFLASDSPYIIQAGLKAGQGLICNNILHDRSGFDEDEDHKRLLYRLRYYDRTETTEIL